jgi:hypothetical protein
MPVDAKVWATPKLTRRRTSAFTALVAPLILDSFAAHGALKDQQKMAPVYRTCWESTLPLTPPADSLALRFRNESFYPLARQRRAPNTRKQGDC